MSPVKRCVTAARTIATGLGQRFKWATRGSEWVQEASKSEIQGGCRCGAVRYGLAIDALPRTYACHCRDCQTWTGSAFSKQAFLPAESLQVSGALAVYQFTTPSGGTSIQRMCPVCHTRIFNTNSARPGIVVVRAGTLDRSDDLEVVAHIWVKRKQPWLGLPEHVATWSEAAPAAELLQALAQR